MPDFDSFVHGGVRYPLVADTTNSLLRDADPALYYLLDYLATCLNTYVGARLKAQAALEGLVLNDAVAHRLHIEPAPFLLAADFRFPVLAGYRRGEQFSDKTLSWAHDVAEIQIDYVLPSLNPRATQQLQPILRSASQVIRHAVDQGFDASYQGGAKVWEQIGIEGIKVASVRYGGYEPIQQTPSFFRAIMCTLAVTERDMPNAAGFEPFGGADIGVDTLESDGTTVALAELSTYQPPTIATLAPSSASKAGGTTVTITGTGFRAPVRVLFQELSVDAEVVTDTTLTVTAPPHAAYPTFMADVTVINGDGQSARRPAAFSFTTP